MTITLRLSSSNLSTTYHEHGSPDPEILNKQGSGGQKEFEIDCS